MDGRLCVVPLIGLCHFQLPAICMHSGQALWTCLKLFCLKHHQSWHIPRWKKSDFRVIKDDVEFLDRTSWGRQRKNKNGWRSCLLLAAMKKTVLVCSIYTDKNDKVYAMLYAMSLHKQISSDDILRFVTSIDCSQVATCWSHLSWTNKQNTPVDWVNWVKCLQVGPCRGQLSELDWPFGGNSHYQDKSCQKCWASKIPWKIQIFRALSKARRLQNENKKGFQRPLCSSQFRGGIKSSECPCSQRSCRPSNCISSRLQKVSIMGQFILLIHHDL